MSEHDLKKIDEMFKHHAPQNAKSQDLTPLTPAMEFDARRPRPFTAS